MGDKKSVLVIGIDPALIDFSQPAYANTGMDEAKIRAGAKASEDALTRLGYEVHTCLVDFGDTAASVVQRQLEQRSFDGVLIGAGIRTIPGNFILFERLVNVVHAHAPTSRLCFNTKPGDTAEAVQRWL